MVTAEMKLLVRPTRAVSNADKLLLVTIISLFTFFMPGQTHDMRVLRAAAANVPPFDKVTVFPNGSFVNIGSSKWIAEWLAAKLNFTVAFVYPSQEEVRARGNEATLDMVTSGRADFTTNGFAITAERYTRMDFSTFHNWEAGHRMVIPRPGEQDRLFAFIKPFDANVWLLLGVSFVVVSLFMGLVTWLSARQSSSAQKVDGREARFSDYLGTYFLYNLNVLTTHGDYLSESKASFIIGVGCWLLGASVLVYGYSSIVVSSITLPNQMPAVNTLEDVAAHPDVSLIIRTDTYIGIVINLTDAPLYKALREKAMRRPGSFGIEGVINSTKLLLTGKYAFPYIETIVEFMVASEYKREGKCRFKMSKRLSILNSYFFSAITKGNKHLVREISIGTMQLEETGLIRQWVKMLPWIPRADKCFADDAKATAKQTSIKLIDLASAFFILGIGLAVSTFAFIAERMFFYRAKRKARVNAFSQSTRR